MGNNYIKMSNEKAQVDDNPMTGSNQESKISLIPEDETKFEKEEPLKNDVETEGEEEEEKDIPNKYNRNCWDRWFRKIGAGSLRGGVFAVASVTFGGGCLAFPKAMATSGIYLGSFIFFASAILSYLTLRYLIDTGLKYKIMDYNDLTKKAVNDNFRIFADINNIILCIGVIMGYQYMIYEFLGNLLKSEFDYNYAGFNKIILIVICVVFVQIPLSLLKNISYLQYASICATVSLLYTILLVVIESPFYNSEYKKNNPDFSLGIFPPDLGFNWLNTVGVFLFGFCNHNGVFQVFTEMDRPTKRRCIKVLNRSMGLEIFLYLSIAFGGFFSFYYDCKDVFINRDNLPTLFNGQDYFMDVGKYALIVCLNCVMAINYNIMRGSIVSLVFKGVPPSFMTDFCITVGTYILSNVIVFFVSDATTILGFIGGISTVVISFVCPIVIDIRLGGNAKYAARNIFNYIFLGVISLLGVASTAYAVVKFVQDLNSS